VWKYLLLWLPMVLIAFANGALRELWLRKITGELRAHQISTVLLVLLFAVYIWIVVRIWPPSSVGQAFAIGVMWLGLTLAFEFLLGRYVSGLSWNAILRDYDLLAGRLWVLVPLWVAVAPYIFYRLQKPN
jgi:hypothetical protein